MDESASVSEVALQDDEIDADGMLKVMDLTGHFEVRWGKKKAEVDMAEAQFNDLLSKGYAAFKKTWIGRKGKETTEFNPKERAYIFEKRPPTAAEQPKQIEKKDGPIEVEAKKEDAAKSERFESAKLARNAAIERAKSARTEQDQASVKRSEARSMKDAAAVARSSAAERESAAVRRLEEATKALDAATSTAATPATPGVPSFQAGERAATDDPAKIEEPGARLAAATTERDAAAAAVAETKKAREDAETKLGEAQRAFDAATRADDSARQRCYDAEAFARLKRTECDDAEKDLKGEFEYEQTRKFDKKADHTLVPPLRGG